jgi:hypothetical protein
MTPVPRLIAAQDPFRTHKLFYYMHITSKWDEYNILHFELVQIHPICVKCSLQSVLGGGIWVTFSLFIFASLSAKCKTLIFCHFSGVSDTFNAFLQLLFACNELGRVWNRMNWEGCGRDCGLMWGNVETSAWCPSLWRHQFERRLFHAWFEVQGFPPSASVFPCLYPSTNAPTHTYSSTIKATVHYAHKKCLHK